MAPDEARRQGVLFSIGLVGSAVATGLSFVSAVLALAIYAGLAIFYIFPWLPNAKTPSDATLA